MPVSPRPVPRPRRATGRRPAPLGVTGVTIAAGLSAVLGGTKGKRTVTIPPVGAVDAP